MTFEAIARGDYLASFCFVDEGDIAAELTRLSELAEVLEQQYQYFEIIYVVAERHRPLIERTANLISNVRNLRILLVNNDINFYRRRAVAASEGIGDVLVLSAISDLHLLNVAELADRAFETGEIVMARRTKGGPILPVWYWVMAAISPYRVNARDMRTLALPRRQLTEMLGRPTLGIDLRFEAKKSIYNFTRSAVDAKAPLFGGPNLRERMELLGELVTVSAPRLLKLYAALSFLTSGLAMLYVLYAVVLVLIQSTLVPGWFTTALAQGGSVAFLALGFCLVSLGLADVIERVSGRTRNAIVDEIANINFFRGQQDLNVELHNAAPRTSEEEAPR